MQNTEFRSVSEDESWSTRVKPALPSAIAEQLDVMEAGATRPWKVRVRLPEEKFSDVALGVELVDDFHNDRCDLAVLVTNDSDLTPAIEKVVDQGHVVGVFSPATTLNRHLNKVASWGRPMRRSIFAGHQLPDTVWRDGTGTKFERPNAWKARK